MEKKSTDAAYAVEELIEYAVCHLSMREEDRIYARNALLAALRLEEPSQKQPSKASITQMIVPDRIINELVTYAVSAGIISSEESGLFDTYLMGLVTPVPSAVIDTFRKIKEESGSEAACLYLYNLSIKNNYIRYTDVQKNICWMAPTKKADLEITINLSKPEKDNKEIQKLKSMPQSSYPKCLLCKENVGYYGRLNHPARENLRTIPVTLDGAKWHMQFSPYVYYNEHCIVFSDTHSPMVINDSTFRKLADFEEQFPNYFIGSNACLPIVGGSILVHEHFQGGNHAMPMHKAKIYKEYQSPYEGVSLSTLDWYNSVVHMESKNKEQLAKAAAALNAAWVNYSDESVDVIAKTSEQHNAVTPIMRRNGQNYIIDMILRNNRTSKEYPDGIFHAHPQYHNIKKEGIGIIEVMGLFILPARLKREIEGMKEFLTGIKKFTPKVTADEAHPLKAHFGMISDILKKYGNEMSPEDADIVIREYINDVCKKILECTAVFKDTEQGHAAFDRFLGSLKA